VSISNAVSSASRPRESAVARAEIACRKERLLSKRRFRCGLRQESSKSDVRRPCTEKLSGMCLQAPLSKTQVDSIFASSLATASPTSPVLAFPPISVVRIPPSIVFLTASSTAFASSGRFKEYWSSIAVERIAATGLTTPLPEISGAEPTSG